jgi:lactoylglutathione lyase
MMAFEQGDGVVEGFFHAGVTVRDMDASLRFYVEGLGLAVSVESEAGGPQAEEIWGVPGAQAKVVFLTVPGSDVIVELFEFRSVERQPASARPPDYGAGHFCLYVRGIDAIHRRLVALGYRGRSAAPVAITIGRHAGTRVIYTIDPDGYHVELYERAPRS